MVVFHGGYCEIKNPKFALLNTRKISGTGLLYGIAISSGKMGKAV